MPVCVWGRATAGRAPGSDPCGYRGSKDRPPAWHIFVKAMSAAVLEPGSLLVGAAVGYMCQPEWLR